MSSNDSRDLSNHRERFNDPIIIPSQSNNSGQSPQGNNDEYSDKVKKNIKKGGCGCLGVLLFLFLIGYCGDSISDEEDDLRYTYLNQDIEQLTSEVTEENILTYVAKKCIESSIYIERSEKELFKKTKKTKQNISKTQLEYFTRQNDNKLLIILDVGSIKDVETSSTTVFVEALIECFSSVEDRLGVDEYYISLQGRNGTLLVYTPEESDLSKGRSNKRLLLPFYDEYVKDSLPSLD